MGKISLSLSPAYYILFFIYFWLFTNYNQLQRIIWYSNITSTSFSNPSSNHSINIILSIVLYVLSISASVKYNWGLFYLVFFLHACINRLAYEWGICTRKILTPNLVLRAGIFTRNLDFLKNEKTKKIKKNKNYFKSS